MFLFGQPPRFHPPAGVLALNHDKIPGFAPQASRWGKAFFQYA